MLGKQVRDLDWTEDKAGGRRGGGASPGAMLGRVPPEGSAPGWLGAEQQGWVGLKGTTSSAGRASHLGSELVPQLQCLPRERGRAVRPQAHRRDKQVSSCPGTAADTSVQRVCAVGGGPAPTKTMS